MACFPKTESQEARLLSALNANMLFRQLDPEQGQQVVMAMRVRNDILPFRTGVDATRIMQASRLVSTVSGFAVQFNKAIVGRNAFALYLMLCKKTGTVQDPSVLDIFLSAVDFMHGAPPAPWWHYSALRKEKYGQALQSMIDDDPTAPHRVEEACAMYGP